MKSRIEELAQKSLFIDGSADYQSVLNALNEALELAAKECEKQPDEYQLPDQRLICAEAIRKLKCS